MVDEPSEAKLLAKNFQAVNSQLMSYLKASRKVVEEFIFKCKELTNHYETLVQDKQVAYEALEHQLGCAKVHVYDLDNNLKASQYEVRKLEDELEAAQQQQGISTHEETVPQVSVQGPKRKANFHCFFQELKELLELVPPIANLEQAYALDRQVFYTHF